MMDPQALFGIQGLTVGGLGIWGILLSGLGIVLKNWYQRSKLSLEDRTALVAGFSKQAELLQHENRLLRREVSTLLTKVAHLVELHNLCQQETTALRLDVLGFKRQLHAIASAALVYIPQDKSAGTFVGAMIDEILSPMVKEPEDGRRTTAKI